MTVKFVDVSHHDWDRRGGPLDWGRLAVGGLGDVMVARASYGDPQTFSPATRHFGDFMTAAKAAGYAARGGYHDLIRSPDQAGINRQVDYLRRELDKHGANWAMCDVENFEELVGNGLSPRWVDVQRFHDRWYAVDQRVMAWYIAHWVWQGQLGSHDLTGLRGPLFNASYAGGMGSPAQIYAASKGDAGVGYKAYGGRHPDVWQFTSTAWMPGLVKDGVTKANAKGDCNAYLGTREQLLALLLGVSSDGDDSMAGSDATWVADLVNQANWKLDAMKVVLEAQTATLAELARALAAVGTNSPEVSQILTGVRASIDAQTAALAAIVAGTVADLGEGGAAQVRKHAANGESA